MKLFGKLNEEEFVLDDIKNVEISFDVQIILICSENFNAITYKGEDK